MIESVDIRDAVREVRERVARRYRVPLASVSYPHAGRYDAAKEELHMRVSVRGCEVDDVVIVVALGGDE